MEVIKTRRNQKHIVLGLLREEPRTAKNLECMLGVSRDAARNVIRQLRAAGCGIACQDGKYVLMFVPDMAEEKITNSGYINDVLDILKSDVPRVEWTNQEIVSMLDLTFNQFKYALSRIEKELGIKIYRRKIDRTTTAYKLSDQICID